MARSGLIGQEIDIGIKFYQNGSLFDPFVVNPVKIFDAASGGNLLATLPVIRLSVGFYQATWDIPDTIDPGTYYDQWEWVAEDGMSSNIQRYSFDLALAGIPSGATDAEAAIARAGCRPKPTWLHLVGVRRTEDIGNGMGLRLTWGEAAPNDQSKQVHYNVYTSNTRFGVFNDGPDFITTARQVVVNVPPGKLHYFAVRATEYNPTEFNITELEQVGNDLFQYPEPLELENDIDAYGATINVNSTNGYPEKGFLKVNSEVIQYSSKDGENFFVEDTERGAFQTVISSHLSGSTIELFRGIEDGNTVILNETAAWHESFGTPRNVDAIGQFNVDEDGYRAANADNITPDFTVSDNENADFPAFDFKGYHRPSLQETLDGRCVNSYAGGEFNGVRGLNFQERNLARLDFQLQTTGKPAILLKRKWTGKRCSCMGMRREHQRTRCPFCFGTGFDGGYDRFMNTRPISELWRNVFGMIMVRVHPYADDLEIVGDQGLRHPSELTAWTLTVPTLKDRDLIILFNRDNNTGEFFEEFRYEVLDVTRNILVLGDSGRQQFRMRRHDKTDVIYQYSVNVES